MCGSFAQLVSSAQMHVDALIYIKISTVLMLVFLKYPLK